MSAIDTVETQQRSSVGIGASEIAAALGLNPYRSRYGLWLEKTGRGEPFNGNVATRLGQLLEPFARQRYANETGFSVEIPPTSVFHPEIPWARCTPDGIVPASHLVQFKSTGYFPGKRWAGEPPIEVQCQVQWEMFVTGHQRNDVAVLIGGDELEWERFICGASASLDALVTSAQFRIYTVMRDDIAIAEFVEQAARFWALVQKDTPPPIDDSEECQRFHEKRGTGKGVTMDAVGEVADLVRALREQKLAEKSLEVSLKLTKNRLRAALADAGADAIDTGDGFINWQRRTGKRETDWQKVARLIANRHGMTAGEFDAIAQQHTTQGEPHRAIVTPRKWGKED